MTSKILPKESGSRLATLQPPEWATWSLNSTTETKSDGIRKRKRGENKDDTETHVSDTFKLQSLLQHRNDEDISRSEWYDCYDDQPSEIIAQQMSDEEEDLKELGEEVEHVQSLLNSISSDSKIGSPEKINSNNCKPGYYDFSPLHPLERDELRLHLRISGYDPKKDKPVNQTDLILESHRRNLTSDNLEDSEGIDPKKFRQFAQREIRRNREIKMNKENDQKRKAFENLCRITMPRRHIDWLIAQIIYPPITNDHQSNIKGTLESVNDILKPNPSFVNEEYAIRVVKRGKMTYQDSAAVMFALATASGVETSNSKIEMNKLRQNRCIREAQSTALINVMRQIFPSFFEGIEKLSDQEDDIKVTLPNGPIPNITEDVKPDISKPKVRKDRVKKKEESDDKSEPRDDKSEPRNVKSELRKSLFLPWRNDSVEKQQSGTKIELPKPLPLPFKRSSVEVGARDTPESSTSDSALKQNVAKGNTSVNRNDDDETCSGGSDWADLEYDKIPLEGIVELSESLERCGNHKTFKAFKNHILFNHEGEIPSWMESRLQPVASFQKDREEVRRELPKYPLESLDLTIEDGEEDFSAKRKLARERKVWEIKSIQRKIEKKEVEEIIQSEIERYKRTKANKRTSSERNYLQNEVGRREKLKETQMRRKEKKEKEERERIQRLLRKMEKKSKKINGMKS